jgi:hypothetical protein
VAEGAVAQNHSHVVVIDSEPSPEVAYWLKSVPDVLKVAAPVTYFGDWAVSATEVETAINAKWAAVNSPASVEDVAALSIRNLSATEILVSGLFDKPAVGRVEKQVLIRHLNPQVDPRTGNVSFEPVGG